MASLLRTDKEITEIYHRQIDTVYRICYSFMKNKPEAEDMVQGDLPAAHRLREDLRKPAARKSVAHRYGIQSVQGSAETALPNR